MALSLLGLACAASVNLPTVAAAAPERNAAPAAAVGAASQGGAAPLSRPTRTAIPGGDLPDPGTAEPATIENGRVRPLDPSVGPPLEIAADGEVVSWRTASSKTFLTDKVGVYRTEAYTEPVHVKHADGGWDPVDLSLAARTEQGGRAVLEPAASPVPAVVASRIGQGDLVTVPLADDISLGWSMRGARRSAVVREPAAALDERRAAAEALVEGQVGPDGRPVEPAPVVETVRYPEVMAGVDLEVTPLTNGIKEELVLHSARVPTVYEFPLAVEGLTPRLDPDSGSVLFADAEGVDRLVMAKPWAADSSRAHDGVAPAESDQVRYELAGTAAAPVLRLVLDAAWLADPARVFPVRVDPTTTDLNAALDTYLNSCYSNNYGSTNPLKVGGADCQRASYLKFDLSSLAGKSVTAASLSVFNSYSYSCSARAVNVYNVTGYWDSSLTSHWPGPAFALPAVASVSFAMGYTSGACPRRAPTST